MAEKGVIHAYLEFEGEQQGIRKAEKTIRSQKAELNFYALVFGFEPADESRPVEIVR